MSPRVEMYSGYTSDETPRRFEVGGAMLDVIEVVERWRTPLESGFRIRAEDGRSYILRKSRVENGAAEWTADPAS